MTHALGRVVAEAGAWPRRRWILGVVAIAAGCARRSAPSSPTAVAPAELGVEDPLASLAWLAGTWVSEATAGPHTVEHWLAPDGGMMVGVNRTVEHGQAVFFEFLRIVIDDGGIAYLASPRGRDPATRFGLVEQGERRVAFENPEHEFPQRIEYTLQGDRLTMTVSGEQDGAVQASRWVMRRADPSSP